MQKCVYCNDFEAIPERLYCWGCFWNSVKRHKREYIHRESFVMAIHLAISIGIYHLFNATIFLMIQVIYLAVKLIALIVVNEIWFKTFKKKFEQGKIQEIIV